MHSAHINDGDLWIIMEFMEGGTLTQAVQKQDFKTEHVAFVAHGMLESLSYLHGMNIAHRDLKSANIMLTINAEIKIIDFGLCCLMEAPRLQTVGSPFWMAPEMIKHKPHAFPVDIWSFGICLLELANGEPPNRDNGLKALTQVGLHGITQTLNDPGKYHHSLSDFLQMVFKVDPDARPTAATLLQHGLMKLKAKQMEMKALLLKVFTSAALDTFM